MTAMSLQIGDEVIHPRYGFGTVLSVQTREHDGAPVEYYEIELAERGLLSVPVARAAALGVRRLVNGVAATLALLGETAVPLPEHARQRSVELAARWVAPEASALAGGVRDLLAFARKFGLKGSDQQWLTRAHARLGAEAARVDGVPLALARGTIGDEIKKLKTPPADAQPSAPAAHGRRRAH